MFGKKILGIYWKVLILFPLCILWHPYIHPFCGIIWLSLGADGPAPTATMLISKLHMFQHYSDVILGVMASQITSLTIVYSTVYSDQYQRKHQSSRSLAFVRGIHRWPVNSPHKWPVARKMFPFDDVIMKAGYASINIPLAINDPYFMGHSVYSAMAHKELIPHSKCPGASIWSNLWGQWSKLLLAAISGPRSYAALM